jgi:hypothetical protein
MNVSANYLDDHTAVICESGTASGTAGTWLLGRDSSGNTRFIVATNGGFAAPVRFPDDTTGTDGNTKQWNFYSVIFSNGFETAYYAGWKSGGTGLVLVTNGLQTTNISTLQFGANANALTQKGRRIGVNGHGGTWAMEKPESGSSEPYPNNGWMNGEISDLRIWNRVLTSNEIAGVYSTDPAVPASPGIGAGANVGFFKGVSFR